MNAKYRLQTTTDGTLLYLDGRTPTSAAPWWQGFTSATAHTSATIAAELNISRRTVEGWRQGKVIAHRFRPQLHELVETAQNL